MGLEGAKMKSLKQNGLYAPHYNEIGLSVMVKKEKVNLSNVGEQMAIQFVRKLDTDYVKDPLFVTNFLIDFSKEIGKKDLKLEDINWKEIQKYIEDVKSKTDAMTKEEKKQVLTLKKSLREKLKEIYGYATLDGEKVEVANWIAEPASIFMSRGANPNRGKWKRAILKSDIILNTSDGTGLEGWKEIAWEPSSMWVAKWISPLDGKEKYVWVSASSKLRQDKDMKKWEKAETLEQKMPELGSFILDNLTSKGIERRKLATAVYLIRYLGIRVGDEKIEGERGTVGCTTLRSKNLSIIGNNLKIDFIGKDCVRFTNDIGLPEKVLVNLKDLISKAGEGYVFDGLNSNSISKFLQEKIPHISAKTFRTFLASETFKDSRKIYTATIEGKGEAIGRLRFKFINLDVAKKLNHKRKLPKNWKEMIVRKEERVKKLLEKYDTFVREFKLHSDEKLQEKMSKAYDAWSSAQQDLEFSKASADFNLGTSLGAYISPKLVVSYCKEEKVPIEKVYSTVLLSKYKWSIGKEL